MKREAIRILALTVAAGTIGVLSSYRSSPGARERSSQSVARSSTLSPDMLCSGGSDYPVGLTLSAITDSVGTLQRGTVAIQLINKTLKATDISYAFELVTDTGQSIQPAAKRVRLGILEGASMSDTFALPNALADGYYLARLTAAAKDVEGTTSVGTTSMYLYSTGGKVAQMDATEWHRHSLANRGGSRT